MALISSTNWRVPADAELIWRSWDPDEVLVYHAQSGDTHYLNPVAAEVLRYLQAHCATADELTSELAGTVGVEADNALLNQIELLLQQLDGLGLIEPIVSAQNSAVTGEKLANDIASNASTSNASPPSESVNHESP